MLNPSNIRVRAFDRGYLDIFWDLGSTFEDLNSYDIFVQRAEAEFGPYVDVSPALRAVEHFRDAAVRGYTSFYQRIYYRLRVVKRSTGEEKTCPDLGGARLEARPDLAALEIARHANLRLKESEGRVVWIFPRKRSGQRCTTCFDRTTMRSRRADCPVCYGTTYVGGYHTPVKTYAQVLTPQEMTYHTQNGPVESLNSMIKLGNYPELSEGDVVIEAENIRWKIGTSITRIEKSRALVRQQAPIHAIPVSDIEFSLPVKMTLLEAGELEASPHRNYTNPSNLETAGFDPASSSIFGKK
jgi:hypothetical protein